MLSGDLYTIRELSELSGLSVATLDYRLKELDYVTDALLCEKYRKAKPKPSKGLAQNISRTWLKKRLVR